jgi:hypothetical protein
MVLWLIYIALTALAIFAEYLDIKQSEIDFKAGAVESDAEPPNVRPSALDLIRKDLPWYIISAASVAGAILLKNHYIVFGGYTCGAIVAAKHYKGYKVGVNWLKANKK